MICAEVTYSLMTQEVELAISETKKVDGIFRVMFIDTFSERPLQADLQLDKTHHVSVLMVNGEGILMPDKATLKALHKKNSSRVRSRLWESWVSTDGKKLTLHTIFSPLYKQQKLKQHQDTGLSIEQALEKVPQEHQMEFVINDLG